MIDKIDEDAIKEESQSDYDDTDYYDYDDGSERCDDCGESCYETRTIYRDLEVFSLCDDCYENAVRHYKNAEFILMDRYNFENNLEEIRDAFNNKSLQLWIKNPCMKDEDFKQLKKDKVEILEELKKLKVVDINDDKKS